VVYQNNTEKKYKNILKKGEFMKNINIKNINKAVMLMFALLNHAHGLTDQELALGCAQAFV